MKILVNQIVMALFELTRAQIRDTSVRLSEFQLKTKYATNMHQFKNNGKVFANMHVKMKHYFPFF